MHMSSNPKELLAPEQREELLRLRHVSASLLAQLEQADREADEIFEQWIKLRPGHAERGKLRNAIALKRRAVAALRTKLNELREEALQIAKPLRDEDRAVLRSLHQNDPYKLRFPVRRSSLDGKLISLKATL